MAQDQKPGFSLVTSKGEAHYPKLNVPDTKFKDGGEYNCKLWMPEDGRAKVKSNDKDSKYEPASVADLEARLEAEYEASIKAAKRAFKNQGKKPGDIKPMTKPWGWNDPTDDDGNPIPRTAEHGPRLFYISAKMTASGTSQRTGEHFEMRPDIFDAGSPGNKPKKITAKCPMIGHKSTLVLSCQAAHFLTGPNAGITIRLNSVQVIEIKNEGGRDADSQGFDSEEDGYQGEEDTGTGGKPSGGAAQGKRSVDMDDSDDDDDSGDDDGPSDD